MDTGRFLKACQWALSGESQKQGIGTLGEKTLHSAVKYYFQPDPQLREVRMGRFVADALWEEGVLEVQTRSLERLRPKLEYFLDQGPVTVAYPVSSRKTVVWIGEDGAATPPRKSPRKPTAGAVLPELYKLRPLLAHPRLRLCVLLLEVEEYRLLDGWSRDRKRGSTRFERIPLGLLDEVWVRAPGDYRRLLPQGLACPFTSRDLGKALGISPKKATLAANVLRGMEAIRWEGKRGNAFLYTLGDCPPESDAAVGRR